MRVVVEDATVFEEKTSQGTVLHKQQVKMPVPGAPAVYFKIDAPEGKAYPVGEYSLDGRSFRVGRFGGLEIDPYRVALIPLASAVANRPPSKVA